MNSVLPLLKFIAKSTSIISIILIAAFFIHENSFQFTPRDILLMLFFPAGVIAGLIICWFRPAFGALISFFCLGAFYALNFYLSGEFPSGPYFLLFTLPALLFFIYRYFTFNALMDDKRYEQTHQ